MDLEDVVGRGGEKPGGGAGDTWELFGTHRDRLTNAGPSV